MRNMYFFAVVAVVVNNVITSKHTNGHKKLVYELAFLIRTHITIRIFVAIRLYMSDCAFVLAGIDYVDLFYFSVCYFKAILIANYAHRKQFVYIVI